MYLLVKTTVCGIHVCTYKFTIYVSMSWYSYQLSIILNLISNWTCGCIHVLVLSLFSRKTVNNIQSIIIMLYSLNLLIMIWKKNDIRYCHLKITIWNTNAHVHVHVELPVSNNQHYVYFCTEFGINILKNLKRNLTWLCYRFSSFLMCNKCFLKMTDIVCVVTESAGPWKVESQLSTLAPCLKWYISYCSILCMHIHVHVDRECFSCNVNFL